MSEDPIHDEQLAIVESLLARTLSPQEYQGFLIIGNRFVDRFGNSRIGELAGIFQTDSPGGKKALAASLSRVAKDLGSYQQFLDMYPVIIIPPLPSYPLFPIIGVERIRDVVYRVLNRTSSDIPYIKSTGRLPNRPKPSAPVLREAPRAHWCSYKTWESPEETRGALQILPGWSDCEARAVLRTDAIKDSAFVPYSIDPNDAETKGLGFHGYFFEGITQDHDELSYPGNAVQICVYGEPEVALLEEWNPTDRTWVATWFRSAAPPFSGSSL
jgi:hypothetical protein